MPWCFGGRKKNCHKGSKTPGYTKKSCKSNIKENIMKRLIVVLLMIFFLVGTKVSAQKEDLVSINQLVLVANHPGPVISKDIYGHFSEHLGNCIYGGLWVGPDSKIPNT